MRHNKMGNREYYQRDIARDLIISTVEKILVNVDVSMHKKVVELLDKKFRCSLNSCCEHPEYLRQALDELFQSESNTILKIIAKDLRKNHDVEEFLRKLQK